jgi:hypothetical protein
MPVQELQVPEVTRTEIAAAIGDALGVRRVGRDELVAAAASAGARAEVLGLLRGLPAREFTDLRQLWSDLPDLPVR